MSDPFLLSEYLPKSDSCVICGAVARFRERLWGRKYCQTCYEKFHGSTEEG